MRIFTKAEGEWPSTRFVVIEETVNDSYLVSKREGRVSATQTHYMLEQDLWTCMWKEVPLEEFLNAIVEEGLYGSSDT